MQVLDANGIREDAWQIVPDPEADEHVTVPTTDGVISWA